MWNTTYPLYLNRCWSKVCLCLSTAVALLIALLFSMHQPALSQAPLTDFCDQANMTEIPSSECQALVALYSSTNANITTPNWITHTGWLETYTPCSTPWYGVRCSGGNVESVSLIGNNLTGTLPPEIGNFPKLQQLDLRDNSLTGAIPLELCQLTDLKFLFLGGQYSPIFQYEGPLPNCLENLTELTSLKIARTKITGPIPPGLGKLSKLVNLFLPSNRFTGQIPPTLTTNMTNLEVLDLANNQLAGPIPTDLGKLKNLQILTLRDNQLSGQIPAELGNLTKTIHFQLQHNRLQGPIPASLGNLVNAKEFLLQSNALTGTVPASLVKIGSEYLKTPGNTLTFSLDYNLLTAEDPTLGQFLQTQTLPPMNLRMDTPTATAVTLTWGALGDTTTAGNYTVGIGDSPDTLQPWINTTSKFVTSANVTNLCPGRTYYAAVRTHTFPHNQNGALQQNDLVSEWSQTVQFTTAPRDLKLLSIYMLALDNGLDSRYESLVHAIEQATAEDTSKVAVILVDRKGEADTQVWSAQCGQRTLHTNYPDFGNSLEYNMTDPVQLATFLKWARTTYSAPQTIVTYIGHGVALAPAVDISQYISGTGGIGPDPNGNFPIPGGQNIHVDTISDNHPVKALISPHALSEALRIATDQGQYPFTVLDIVHCFAGTLEELYELSNPEGKPIVETIVSSPNYAYSGPELLRRALLAVQPAQTAQQMAAAITNSYHQALVDASEPEFERPHLIMAVQPTQTIALKQKVDILAQTIVTSFVQSPAETVTKIMNVDGKVAKYNTTICKGPNDSLLADFNLDVKDGLADLADLANRLGVEFAENPIIHIAATNVVNQVKQTIIASVRLPGKPWFANDPKPNWPFDDATIYQGIAIYADFHGVSIGDETYIGWQAHWYTPKNNSGDNPYPYAFVRIGNVTWADVLHRFWENRTQHVKQHVKTVICTTMLPEVSYWQYLPVVMK